MNALITAKSLESAIGKLNDYIRKFDWQLLGIEDCRMIEDDWVLTTSCKTCSKEPGKMINRSFWELFTPIKQMDQ